MTTSQTILSAPFLSRLRFPLLAALALSLTIGCGGSSDDDDDDKEKDKAGEKAQAAEEAVEACNDFRDTMIDVGLVCAEELGETATREEFEEEIDSVITCSDADDIENKTQFYDDCLPALEAIDCDMLVDGEIPYSCEGQILFEE